MLKLWRLFPPFLQRGSSGAAVHVLYKILIWFQGWPGFEEVDNLVDNGVFGPVMARCVMALQRLIKSNEIDGHFGPGTRQDLLAWSSEKDVPEYFDVSNLMISDSTDPDQRTLWTGPYHVGAMIWPMPAVQLKPAHEVDVDVFNNDVSFVHDLEVTISNLGSSIIPEKDKSRVFLAMLKSVSVWCGTGKSASFHSTSLLQVTAIAFRNHKMVTLLEEEKGKKDIYGDHAEVIWNIVDMLGEVELVGKDPSTTTLENSENTASVKTSETTPDA